MNIHLLSAVCPAAFGSVNDDPVDQFVHDLRGKLRELLILLDDIHKVHHIVFLPLLAADRFGEFGGIGFQLALLRFISCRHCSETLIGDLTRYIILIQTLKQVIKLIDTLFCDPQCFSGGLHLTVLCHCGVFHCPADKLVLIVPYKLRELVQLTEDNFGQYASPDIMGGAFVRIVCVGGTHHMLLIGR